MATKLVKAKITYISDSANSQVIERCEISEEAFELLNNIAFLLNTNDQRFYLTLDIVDEVSGASD